MRTRLLDAPPEGWDGLLRADPGATPAHRAEVARALAQVLPGTEARWIAVEDEAGLAGGMPLCIERRAGARWLHALPFLLPGAPLARAGAHAEVDDAAAETLAALATELGVAGGEWVLYRPGAAWDEAAAGRLPGTTTRVTTAVISVSRDTPIEARLDRDTRHLLRRSRAAGVEFSEDPAALAAVYALHLAQSRRWPGHRPLPLELSRRLLSPVADGEPAARLLVVRGGGRLLAGMLVLDHDREVFAWWSGARAEARASAATHALMAGAAGWAAARGRDRLNLGGSAGLPGLSAFKRTLGAAEVEVPVRWLDASRAGWPARMLAAAQARARRGRFRGTPA